MDAEVIQLGAERGMVVDEAWCDAAGHVGFSVAAESIEADVYKARTPDVALVGARVCLVARLQDGEPVDEYALMVDDEYWGRRVQPAEFQPPAYFDSAVQFCMGYRLEGSILEDGQPVADANVSLEGVLIDADGEEARFWDSLEYNELVYSESLETYVEGATVLAPIMTDANGEFEFFAPKGHGAIYQRSDDRRDDTPETAAMDLPRYVDAVYAVYLGRKALLEEDALAEIDINSGTLEIHAEPGAFVRASSMDDIGEVHQVPPGGVVTIDGLPACEHSVVQFRRLSWGEWDDTYGCPRVNAEVSGGETTVVSMPAMEHYDEGGDTVAGRVYHRMGVPAGGIDIVAIDWETCEVVGVVATTGGDGYWEAQIPPEGFGGDLWIHDTTRGSVPVEGFPYSDIVLGARAYSAFVEMYKPEAWRSSDRGHKNFQYVPDGIIVENCDSGVVYETEEASYGGWVTTETLPKYEYVADVADLLYNGPQQHSYRLKEADRLLIAEFTLGGQSFEGGETLAGVFRATGYYPEGKFLIGGKIAGNALKAPRSYSDSEKIDEAYPEAARVGLEFGTHIPYTQITTSGIEEGERTCFTDLVCPYCGGPAHRDPDGGGFARGFCRQCASYFGFATAMDCRTHFATPTIGEGEPYHLTCSVVKRSGGHYSREVMAHWRPDLYDETDDFITQDDPMQPTNAPRWVARHVSEMGDGLGFGSYDSGDTPAFTPGHEVAYFNALPEIDRDCGLTQMKLIFPSGFELAEDCELELDCTLDDGSTETVTVALEAGVKGPDETDMIGDIVPLVPELKLLAEKREHPYVGVGLYVGVADVRVTSSPPPADLRFSVVNDCPWLADITGIEVDSNQRTPTALQFRARPAGVELLEGPVGQLFLFYPKNGDIKMTRRSTMTTAWKEPVQVTDDGESDEPGAEKDNRGLLVLWRSLADGIGAVRSRDDGRSWE
ncbi:MAG: hypothetical protein ACLFWB_11920 [Armatimonadota bacterium]